MRRAIATGPGARILAATRPWVLGLAAWVVAPWIWAENSASPSGKPMGEPGPGFRRWRLPVRTPSGGGVGAGFRALDLGRSGIQFTNRLEEASAARNRILENGSGVALGDVDGNGLPDLYLCSLEGTNALYLNRGGWRFEEAAKTAGVDCSGQRSSGCLLVDVDGDRDLDLLVNALGGGPLYGVDQ